MNYEKRIIAFIDLLGFKDLVANADCDRIKMALDILRDFTSDETDFGGKVIKTTKTREITQFSDSIVLSAAYNENSAVFDTIYDLQLTVSQLLHHGFLCRGGVTVGELVHTNQYLYGQAMVDAYLLESTKAKYPRIIVDDRLIRIAETFHAKHHNSEQERDFVNEILSKDEDGCYYIDYFAKVQSELESPNHALQYLTHIENAVQTLGDPILKAKRDWLVNKYNGLLNELKNTKSPYLFLNGHASTDSHLQEELNKKSPLV